MKYLFFIANLFLIIPQDQQKPVNPEANMILSKVSDKLNSLKTIKYDLTREMKYPSNGYHVIVDWTCYFDFSMNKSPIHFKYQVDASGSKLIYNGTEKFELDSASRTMKLNLNPEKEDFEGLSFLYNSLITLRNALPLIINDNGARKSVRDTIIYDRSHKLITIDLGKRRIQNLGDAFDIMQTKYNLIYDLVIDPNNYLPVAVIQRNNSDNDFIKTTFKNLELHPAKPAENSWYYSTYKTEYASAQEAQIPEPIAIGSPSPDWKLPYFGDNKTLSLSELKGKVVILEFWIKNCSYCITSVPYLNALSSTFQNDDFELISLNAYDDEEQIAQFVNKHNVEYPVLMDARHIAESYGVYAYPTLFILDKSGKVLVNNLQLTEYTLDDIEKLIRENL